VKSVEPTEILFKAIFWFGTSIILLAIGWFVGNIVYAVAKSIKRVDRKKRKV